MDTAVGWSALACACLIFTNFAHAELNLKPQLTSYELDGVKFTQLSFTDDKKQVTYSPPVGWDYSGSGAKLALHPKNKAQAEATVTRQPLLEALTFDEAGMKKLADEVMASLPGGNTNAKIVSQESSPVAIDRKPTVLITVSYDFYGQSYGRSVMFMDRDKEQFRFQLTSLLSDFKELQQAFFASHFSWQNL